MNGSTVSGLKRRVAASGAIIAIALCVPAGSAHATELIEMGKVTAADGAGGASFGLSVAIDGTVAATGAPYGDGSSSGTGAAYVYEMIGGTWQQAGKLVATDGQHVDEFGHSVAVSGQRVAVGALNGDRGSTSGTGAVYIFEKVAGVWSQTAKLNASDAANGDHFGVSVSLSGNRLLVGSRYDDDRGMNSGSAYLFVHDGTSWSQLAKLTATDGATGDWFGESVSISGGVAIVGAPRNQDNGSQSGSAYVFQESHSWSQVAKLLPADNVAYDQFGIAVSVSGGTAAIGAYGDDDHGGNSGSVYVYDTSTGPWAPKTKLTAAGSALNDYVGYSVSISANLIIAGAYGDDDGGSGCGAAYVFENVGGTWGPLTKLVPSGGGPGDNIGYAVGVSGEFTIVGAAGDDDHGTNSGAAHLAGPRFVSYGSGCAGSGGFVPLLSMTGDPTPSGSVTLQISNGLGGAPAILFMGDTAAALSAGSSCVLLVEPVNQSFGLMLNGVGAGNGWLTLTESVAASMPLGPVKLQAMLFDAGGHKGYSLSNGLSFDVY